MIGNLFSRKRNDNLPYSKDGRPMRYATLNDRNIAGMIGFVLLTIIFIPITNILEMIFQIDKVKISSSIYDTRIQEIAALPPQEQINSLFQLFGEIYNMQSLIVFLILVIMFTSIFFFFWHKYQATPGGMFMSLRVVDAQSFEAISINQNIVRSLVSIFSTGLLFIGFIPVIYSKKKQAWHDKAANTIVIALGKPLK